MKNWIKIENKVFEIISCYTQLTIGSHSTMYVDFNLEDHPQYEKDLLYIYDQKLNNISIETKNYVARGCKMKTLGVNFNKSLSLTISSEFIDMADIKERRDRNLEEVLNKK